MPNRDVEMAIRTIEATRIPTTKANMSAHVKSSKRKFRNEDTAGTT